MGVVAETTIAARGGRRWIIEERVLHAKIALGEGIGDAAMAGSSPSRAHLVGSAACAISLGTKTG